MRFHALLLVVLLSGICAGQPVSAETPATPHLVRAAGMPLNDGALAPGLLTVRVVEGAFTRDLMGETVVVEVIGGKIESARTGADGRAQFAHLPIGGRVRVSATIAGERLESDVFEIPAQSGVRLLLVTGAGPSSALPQSGLPASSEAPAIHEAAVAPGTGPLSVPRADSTDTEGVAVIRAVLATATVFALGFVLFSRRPRS